MKFTKFILPVILMFQSLAKAETITSDWISVAGTRTVTSVLGADPKDTRVTNYNLNEADYYKAMELAKPLCENIIRTYPAKVLSYRLKASPLINNPYNRTVVGNCDLYILN